MCERQKTIIARVIVFWSYSILDWSRLNFKGTLGTLGTTYLCISLGARLQRIPAIFRSICAPRAGVSDVQKIYSMEIGTPNICPVLYFDQEFTYLCKTTSIFILKIFSKKRKKIFSRLILRYLVGIAWIKTNEDSSKY